MSNIRTIRKQRGMSINKLSEISNISLGYLSDLENNKFQNPTLDKLKAIAEALNVSFDDFFKNELQISTPKTEEEILNGLSEEDRLLYKKIKALHPKDAKKILHTIFYINFYNPSRIFKK